MSSRQDIREAFAALVLSEVAGVYSALTYEPGPEAMPARLPVVTMLADLFGQTDVMTGPKTENVWGWEVRVYVDLGQGYEAAQAELEEIVPEVLGVVRANTDLSSSCLWARMDDPGTPIFFAHEAQKRYAWKALQLRAEVEEL